MPVKRARTAPGNLRPALLAALLAFAGLPKDAAARPPDKEPPRRSLKTPPNLDRPTQVSLGLYILNLGKINQSDETMDITGLLTTSWKDERLKFEPSEVGDRVMRRSPDEIWTPELTILNAANLQRKSPIQLSVKPDGTVKFIEFIAVTASCDFNLRKFPFDSQTALVIWEPLSSEVQRIELVRNPTAEGFSKDSYVTLSEWDIVGAETTISERRAELEELAFPRATFRMQIKRNYGFYLFKVAFPLLLITIISWTAFWINPNTGFVPQLNVGITSMLVAVTFNLTISSSLPRVPYSTLMDGFVSTCYVFFFASLLSTVYIHVLINTQKADRAMGLIRRLRWVFPLVFVLVQTAVVATMYLIS
jgi:hypothetical protein